MSPTTLSAGIVTDDADALVAFYTTGLGFSVESTSEFPQGTVTRLRRDEAHCKLYAPAAGAARPPGPEPWFRDAGFAYAALQVDDVDATVARAVDAGASVVAPPASHRPGARYALIRDPQGNVWELLQES